jgi:protein-tyrosine phosphatase
LRLRVGLLDENRPVISKILKAAKLLVALSNLDAKILIHCLIGID